MVPGLKKCLLVQILRSLILPALFLANFEVSRPWVTGTILDDFDIRDTGI
jgi:hypothetical protein